MQLAAQTRLDPGRDSQAELRLETKRHNITGSRSARATRLASSVAPAESPDQFDRQGLLLLHLPQVRLVAKGMWDRMRFAVELDDLIGYGTIGLMHAVERFDPGRGILLKTYAEHRIRGAILDGLRGMDWLPRSARQKERQQRDTPTAGVPGGAPLVAGSKAGAGQPGSRHEPGAETPPTISHPPRMESVFPGGNLSDLEKLAESSASRRERRGNGTNPERLYQRKEQFDQLATAVERLPRRHRQVLHLYYHQELSMRQIGVMLRVHESRVSQLHAAALVRLRKELPGGDTASGAACRKPPRRYSPDQPELPSSSRLTAIQSSSVSTPMVS